MTTLSLFPAEGLPLNALYTLVDLTFTFLIWLIVIWAILGWLITFNVINSYNQFVISFMRSVEALLSPLLRPIRSILPSAGGIDFAPVILIILLIVLERFLLLDVFPWLFG